MRLSVSNRAVPWLLLVAALALLPAGLALGAAAEPAPPPAVPSHTAAITQTANLGSFATEATYKGWFAADGRFRLEGNMTVVGSAMKIGITMVSDGKTMRQLMVTPLATQAMTYDLEKLRRIVPGFDPGQGYSPYGYRDLVKDIAATTKAEKDTLDGREMRKYAFAATGDVRLPPAPTIAPIQAPAVERMVMWVDVRTNLPYRIEAYGKLEKKESRVLAIGFADVDAGAVIPDDTFTLKVPDDAIQIDGTKIIESWLGATKPAAETPK